MISFLKRLLWGRGRYDALADYGAGDWTPVPVSASAQTANVVGWLTEGEPRPRLRRRSGAGKPVRLRRGTIRRLYMHLAGQPEPIPAQPAPAPVVSIRAVGPGPASPAAVSDAPDEKWVELVKIYGEHLTEEELKIIRRQMG